MRLLLDQNLSRDLPSLLLSAGFDVVDTRVLGMQSGSQALVRPVATDTESRTRGHRPLAHRQISRGLRTNSTKAPAS